MSFIHPEFLYYMLPPLLILFGFLVTQKDAQMTFFSNEVIKKLRVSGNTLSLKVRNILFLFIGILIIIALADPVIKEGKIEIKAKSSDIMLALDISDSMLAQDLYPSRLKLAKEKALEFLRLAPNERIGVVAFAKNSYLVSPLSFDHDAVSFLLSKLDTTSITEQGTNFLSILEVVNKNIKKDAKKYLLLLTDGGDKKDFSKEIAYAKKHKITVFILTVATTKGAPIKLKDGDFIKQNGSIILTKLNENISSLAIKTGGVYIQGVNSNNDVKAMLREIKAKAEQKDLKSKEIEKYTPLFYFPVGLALLLLLIATSSMSKREKVYLPSLLLFSLFMVHPTNAKAGLLDFVDLKDAKEAYQNKDYDNATKFYDKYAKKYGNGEAYYNTGNALYKQKKYKEAIKNYDKAKFSDKNARAENFANMGNAHARLGDEKNLHEAVKSYEKSLKIKEDKDIRDNLNAVKKALQKKKQQKKQQQKNNKDNKKQNKNQKSKQNKQDDKNKQEQNRQNQQKNESDTSKDNKQKKKMKSKNVSQDEKANQDKNQHRENKSQKKKKPEEKKKAKAQKQNKKQEKNAQKANRPSTMQQAQNRDKMSDAEEKKWLKKLQQQQNTYLYMLNKEKPMKENKNEKPW